jgi:hypothetical protein
MKVFIIFLAFFQILLTNLGTHAQKPKDLADIWDKQHISKTFPSNVRHKDLKIYLEELKKLNLKVGEVGRSFGNREIYQVEWGKGPNRIRILEFHPADDRPPAERRDVRRHFAGAAGVRSVCQCDVRSSSCGGQRNRASDSTGGAGDNERTPGQQIRLRHPCEF